MRSLNPIPRPLTLKNRISSTPKKEVKKSISLSLQELPLEFWQAMRSRGINYRGEKLVLYPWHEEYFKLLAEFRVAIALVTGAAQTGKTVGCTLLMVWLLTEKGLNTIWSYAGERALNNLVPRQFRPMIKHYLKRLGEKESGGTQNNTLYQYKQSNASFVYTSTGRSTESGLAQAGSTVVGMDADIAFLEERSQYPPGADAPIERRLDASRIPTHPIRALGTPGSGLGIEAEIEDADHYFYPAIACPHCQEEIFLDPKGCILKPKIKTLPSGEIKTVYLSDTGKPDSWHCRDESNAIATAYIACPECGGELTTEHRKTALFKDRYTGVWLKDFLASLDGIPTKRLKAGINLSPLLRVTEYNLASEIIQSGLGTSNPFDWCQQMLGHPSETASTNITLEMIKGAIAAPIPSGEPSFTLCGIDQGRAEHWMWICSYYLPQDWLELSFSEVCDRTIRVVEWAGDIAKGEISTRLEEYRVDFGIIDNEPDIDGASRLCEECKGILEMADQKVGQLEEFKEGLARDGGDEYPCWKIRSEKYQRAVLNGFVLSVDDYPLYRLPSEWTRYYSQKTERSPIRHLTGVSYDPANGKWLRDKNHIDDLFFAAHFCEFAFALQLEGHNTRAKINRAYGY